MRESFKVPISSTHWNFYEIQNHEGDVGFQLWQNGCGIGSASSVEEARKILHAYALSDLRVRRDRARRDLDAINDALINLSADPFYLARFLEKTPC